jgi:hypothetical protein
MVHESTISYLKDMGLVNLAQVAERSNEIRHVCLSVFPSALPPFIKIHLGYPKKPIFVAFNVGDFYEALLRKFEFKKSGEKITGNLQLNRFILLRSIGNVL